MTVTELLQSLNGEQSKEVVNCLQIDSYLTEEEHEPWEAGYIQNVKDLYTSRLRLHCGQFDTLFSSVEEFHRYHCEWLRLNSPIWGRYMRTLAVKYNLIHNTDKTQEETIESSNTGSGTSSSNDKSSRSASGNTLHQLSAANQTDFHNKDKDSSESTENGSSEQNQTHSSENTTSVTHKIRAYGNIGVTTNQQMIKEEREMLKFNLLNKIIDDFKKEMCLLIY